MNLPKPQLRFTRNILFTFTSHKFYSSYSSNSSSCDAIFLVNSVTEYEFKSYSISAFSNSDSNISNISSRLASDNSSLDNK